MSNPKNIRVVPTLIILLLLMGDSLYRDWGMTKIAGSGLNMVIPGGAVLTSVQRQISDLTGSVSLAYIVLLLGFLLVAMYGTLGIH